MFLLHMAIFCMVKYGIKWDRTLCDAIFSRDVRIVRHIKLWYNVYTIENHVVLEYRSVCDILSSENIQIDPNPSFASCYWEGVDVSSLINM